MFEAWSDLIMMRACEALGLHWGQIPFRLNYAVPSLDGSMARSPLRLRFNGTLKARRLVRLKGHGGA